MVDLEWGRGNRITSRPHGELRPRKPRVRSELTRSEVRGKQMTSRRPRTLLVVPEVLTRVLACLGAGAALIDRSSTAAGVRLNVAPFADHLYHPHHLHPLLIPITKPSTSSEILNSAHTYAFSTTAGDRMSGASLT